MAGGFERLVDSRVRSSNTPPDFIPGMGQYRGHKRARRRARAYRPPGQSTPNLNRYPGFQSADKRD